MAMSTRAVVVIVVCATLAIFLGVAVAGVIMAA